MGQYYKLEVLIVLLKSLTALLINLVFISDEA